MFLGFLVPGLNVSAYSADSYGFVNQLYEVCLERSPSSSERDYWGDMLCYEKLTACTVAYDFVFSTEFQAHNYSNAEYVTCMYKIFLGRDPDNTGLNYWTNKLNIGATREQLFAGFVNSDEFDAYCRGCHILKGSYFSGYDRTRVLNVNLFVNRLYTTMLRRRCDSTGMNYWTLKLLNGEISGKDIVTSFAHSAEYAERYSNSSCFVSDLYQVMLNRGAAQSGYWIDLIDNGTPKDAVISGFASSPEFFTICYNYGINSGAPVTGYLNLNGTNLYYYQGRPYTGWRDFNGKTFYFSNGVKWTGWIHSEGKTYYVDSVDGVRTGRCDIDGNTYYFNESGVRQTGLIKIDYYYYYFDANGVMQTDWIKVDGIWYCAFSDGRIATGWLELDSGNYYFNDEGQMQTGWQKIDNKWYYFSSNGKQLNGWLHDTNGKWYYFDNSMVTGLYTVNGKKYYFLSSGAMYEETGWHNFGNSWFYFTTDNYIDTTKTGWQKINDKWYYLSGNSNLITTGFISIGDNRYYFNEQGVMQTGWFKLNGYWYYFDSNGAAHKGWLAYNNQTYYCDANCQMVTGLCYIDNNDYYFNTDGTCVRNQTVRLPLQSGTDTGYIEYYAGSDGICTWVETHWD